MFFPMVGHWMCVCVCVCVCVWYKGNRPYAIMTKVSGLVKLTRAAIGNCSTVNVVRRNRLYGALHYNIKW